ncbi:MAG TPA: nitronate monooxygenase [Thermodesulfobacteriota bacterium]|nr:nitronate monooxygenase [Thermodesulfobacteriota bacterium]
MINTAMTRMFGIQHPLMLAGMNWISNPKLVAAVCNAGGLGTMAIAQYTPEETRKNIRQIREMTDRPFMVNQPLHRGWARENIQAAMEEKVPFINYSLGKPWFIDQVHGYGGKVVGTIAIGKHAARAVELGCDALIVTGHEAAAHGADATSLVLIPLVTGLVKVPVIAAGGFYDGRGLAAALSLGAAGISMGTRFILTKESPVHDNFKQLCLKASEQDTLYSTAFDGMPGRALKSSMSEKMVQGDSFTLLRAIPNALEIKKLLKQNWIQFLGTSVKMMSGEGGDLVQMARLANGTVRHQKAIYDGDTKEGFMFAGQATGPIRDLPPVEELIDRIVAEAETTLKKMGGMVAA